MEIKYSKKTLDLIYLNHYTRGMSIRTIAKVANLHPLVLYTIKKQLINSNEYKT